MRKKLEATIILLIVTGVMNLPGVSPAQEIRLTWKPNPEKDIKNYEIYRASLSTEETKIASAPATDTTYVDNDIVIGTIYSYRITAVDSADNISEFSEAIQVSTDVATPSDPASAVPEKFELRQNYPNPFNPETTFSYSVAETADVSLVVYDLLGRKVQTLVSERKTRGNYDVRWDGRDESGRAVASGIYFVRMAAGRFSKVRKLVLQK